MSELTTVGVEMGTTTVIGTVPIGPQGASGSATLAELTDVDVDAVTDGQVLVWDETTESWIPDTVSGVGTGVDTVNGENGDVVLTAADVGADPAGSAAAAQAAAVQRSNHTGSQAISTVTNLQTTLDAKALDSAVVHDTGNETVAGVKTFSSSPIVPTPASDTDAANKAYVDASGGGGGAVDSVNGETGVVVLSAADVGADPSGSAASAQAAAATDATTKANAAQAFAIQRANHTGTQAISTVSGLQAAIDAKAADADVVHDTGNETIAGTKTFSSAPVVPDSSFTIAKTSGLQAAIDAAGAVDSVNGDTGVVVLTASDVGADPAGSAATAQAAAVQRANHTGSQAISTVTGLQTALDAKAADSAVVHDTGAETIDGVKTFNASPVVPTPTSNTDAANKAYVDLIGGGAGGTVNSVNGESGIVTIDAADVGADPAGSAATAQAYSIQRANHTGSQAISTVTDLQTTLDAKAADADVVHDTGTETIAGVKTFSSAPVVPDSSFTIAKTTGLQTALDAKATSANPTFTGTVTVPDGALSIADTNGLQTALNTIPDAEAIQDIVGGMVAGGTETGIAVTYDDTNARLDFVAEVTQAELDAVSGSIPNTEAIQDIVGAMVSGGTETGIAVSYDDTNARLDFVAEVTQTELDAKANAANPVFTGTVTVPDGALAIADTSGLQAALDTIPNTEAIQDVVGGMVAGGTETGIAVTYDDTNGRLDFVAEVTQTELDAKANAANPVFTGTVTVPDGALAIADTSGLQAALDAKAVDADVVHDTGNETIAGVKTFSSSPIVPTPTTDMQAATKLYVDENAGGGEPDATLTFLADEDTFTRANVVDGNIGNTEVWNRIWQSPSGWSITSNRLHRASGYGTQVIYSHTTANLIETQVTAGATAEWYIMCRVNDDTTRYMLVGVTSGGIYDTQIVDPDAGGGIRAPDVRMTVNSAPTPANNDVLKVYTYDDDGYDVFINDVHIWTGGDSQAVYSRKVGVAANGSTARFEYFKVTPLPGGISRSDWMEDADTIVRTSGAQTVAGVKTFSSSPIIPTTPTTDAQAASKGYVDDTGDAIAIGAALLYTPIGTTTAIENLMKSMRPKVVGDYMFAPAPGPVTTGTVTLSRLIYVPVWLREGTIDRIGVEVTSAVATAVFRLGVYGDNGNGKPSGAPIAEATGTQDGNTLGWGNLTISATIPTMGRYYLAFVSQTAAGTVRVTTSHDPLAPILKGSTQAGALTSTLTTYHEGSVTGALPTAGTMVYTNNVCPVFQIRYSA